MAELHLVEAVNLALAHALAHDPDVVLLGEDIGVNGGVFRATVGLQARFGEARVIDTPLAEGGIVGAAIGMAAMGLKPVAEIQFARLHLPGHRQHPQPRRPHAPPHARPAGLSDGGARAQRGRHPRSRASLREPEAMLAHMPGLRVVMPSSPARAYGLLLAAIRDPDPVVLPEPTRLYRAVPAGSAHDGEALPLDACFPLPRRRRPHAGELGRDAARDAGRRRPAGPTKASAPP